jgi:ubiquitin-conjugating enzyme E2 O
MSGVVIAREVFHTLGVMNSDNHMPTAHNLMNGVDRCFPHRLESKSGNDLSLSRPFVRGDIVLYDGWFGDVYDVFEETVIWFNDGRLVAFEDISGIHSVRPDPNCVGELLDVGYIVQAAPAFVAAKGRLQARIGENAAHSTQSASPGVVFEIKVNSIGVNWRGRRLGDIGSLIQPHPILDFTGIPQSEVRRYGYCSKLLPANYIAGRMDAEFSLGTDVRLRSVAALPARNNPSGADQPMGEAHLMQDQPGDQGQELGGLHTFVVIGVSSTITVRWQDQSVSSHASKDLLTDEELEDNHEVWPYCLVAPLPPASPSAVWRPNRIGAVQSVVSSDRIAQVLWKDTQDIEYISGPNQQLIRLPRGTSSIFPLTRPPQGSAYLEEVSLYDVGYVPDMSLQVLDLVMVIPTDAVDSAATNGPLDSKQSEARYDWIGHVVDRRPDGMVVVRMGALRVPQDRVYPPDRLQFLLSREDVLDLIEGSESSDEHSESSLRSSMAAEFGQGNDPHAATAVWYENDQGERISPAVSEDDAWSTADDSANGDDVEMEDVSPDEKAVADEPAAQVAEDAQALRLGSSTRNGHKEEALQNVDGEVSRPRRLSIHGGPPLFDILDSEPPSAHAYIADDTIPLAGTQMRRIRKEHSILSSSLPEGVYVRSWESRLDLFRVLIIGPPDTPYEFAPFMIDFQLPGDFPNRPPKAFFHAWHSGNSAINPNLYQDGKICLSLLNT